MANILILENDINLLGTLSSLLKSKQHQVDGATTLNLAFKILKKKRFDLVLVDRLLDDGDGFEVVSYLHQESFQTRIIILTQKNQTEERVTVYSIWLDY